MRSSFIPGIALILTLFLEGCGHKGPLMLPESQTQPQASQPQDAVPTGK